MDINKIELQLEEIGLNKSEIKIYFSLLKLGASSTGPIIRESETANSKVYEVLDKLISKGLVSYFTRDGVNYYKAASPRMIIEYLKDRKAEIQEQEARMQSLMPLLMQLEHEKDEKKEAMIFSGTRGVKTAFTNLVFELKKGEEVHIMGVYDFGEQFLHVARYFHKLRSEKGIVAKFLMNREAAGIAREFIKYQPAEIRFMPEKVSTPAIFLIYSDKVIINLAREMTFFVLRSKSASESFEAYFKMMWQSGSRK